MASTNDYCVDAEQCSSVGPSPSPCNGSAEPIFQPKVYSHATARRHHLPDDVAAGKRAEACGACVKAATSSASDCFTSVTLVNPTPGLGRIRAVALGDSSSETRRRPGLRRFWFGNGSDRPRDAAAGSKPWLVGPSQPPALTARRRPAALGAMASLPCACAFRTARARPPAARATSPCPCRSWAVARRTARCAVPCRPPCARAPSRRSAVPSPARRTPGAARPRP